MGKVCQLLRHLIYITSHYVTRLVALVRVCSYIRVYYFWESVSIARKFALLMLAVFIDTNTPALKLLACLVVLLLGVIAVFACKPFRYAAGTAQQTVMHGTPRPRNCPECCIFDTDPR